MISVFIDSADFRHGLCLGASQVTAKCRLAPTVKQTGQESGLNGSKILIVFAVKICKQCLQTVSASGPRPLP